MKKVLVTGGAGFIGSHLCEKLLAKGYQVTCLDNLFTGTRDNMLRFADDPGFRFIEGNVIDPICLEVDQIYNLACPASPVHYQYDPVMTAKTSFLGALNVLELARKTKARVLQASTSEIYGDPLVHPQEEGYRGNVNTIGPRACYDEGKRIAETLFFDYKRQYNVDIRLIRIFNTYGPNMLQNDGRVVSNFIVQALQDQDITVYGDGSQTRSFCYVDDLVAGMIAMMEQDGFSGPMNLGNPHEMTVLELAEMIIEKTGSRSKIVYKDLPADDPIRRKPSIELAEEKLLWQPEVSICDGLERTIAYFKSKL